LTHRTTPEFWRRFNSLSPNAQGVARKNFELLKDDPRHPSLHLKRVGRVWSVRVGMHHRALGTDIDDGILWHWIGTHAEYDRVKG